MKTDTANDVEAIAGLAVAAQGKPATVKTESGREYLVLPEGFTHKDITDPNAVAPILPGHVSQKPVLQTVDSLVDYVNRFKTIDTLLFADIAANRIVAQIDYHSAMTEACDPSSQANYVAHAASMDLPLSFEWKTWTAIDGKLMKQLEFARFLEENGPDIVAPDAGTVLDACRDLQAKRKVNFKKAVRTSSNNENFEWTDETNLTSPDGGIEIPTRFKLAIPVYFGRPPVELYAFLRWELNGEGGLFLGVQLSRAEHVRQAEFKLIVLDVAERTGRLAMFGKLA